VVASATASVPLGAGLSAALPEAQPARRRTATPAAAMAVFMAFSVPWASGADQIGIHGFGSGSPKALVQSANQASTSARAALRTVSGARLPSRL